MKSCFVDNGINTNSTHNGGKICCCRKIYQYLEKQNLEIYDLKILRCVFVNNLDDVVDKCKHTYHNKTKIMPAYVSFSTYID